MGEVMPYGIMLVCWRFAPLMQCFSFVKSIVYSIWVTHADLLLHPICSSSSYANHLVKPLHVVHHMLFQVDICCNNSWSRGWHGHPCVYSGCDICATIRINIRVPWDYGLTRASGALTTPESKTKENTQDSYAVLHKKTHHPMLLL